jgi:hypothetical protein
MAISNLFVPTAVVAADLVTGDEVSITRGSIVEAVRVVIRGVPAGQGAARRCSSMAA